MKRAVIVYNKSTCSSSFPNLTVNYRSRVVGFYLCPVLGVCLCHKFRACLVDCNRRGNVIVILIV